MSHLIVIGFKNNKFKATEVLNDLKRMDDEAALQLNDAAAAYREENSRLVVDQKYEYTPDEGAARGLLIGTIVGALLALPVAAVAGGVAAGTAMVVGTAGGGGAGAMAGALEADWRNEGFGISDDFIRDAGAVLQPGDSAIFAYLHADDPDKILKRFDGTGGKVLVTDLSDEQKARIEAVLNSARSASAE